MLLAGVRKPVKCTYPMLLSKTQFCQTPEFARASRTPLVRIMVIFIQRPHPHPIFLYACCTNEYYIPDKRCLLAPGPATGYHKSGTQTTQAARADLQAQYPPQNCWKQEYQDIGAVFCSGNFSPLMMQSLHPASPGLSDDNSGTGDDKPTVWKTSHLKDVLSGQTGMTDLFLLPCEKLSPEVHPGLR